MIDIETKDGWGPFAKRMSKHLNSKLLDAMLLAAEHARGEIVREVREEFNPGTGALSRSFKATMLTSSKKGVLRSGAVSDSKYADIQDRGTSKALGGPIRPKTVQYLAIPIGDRARRVAGLWPRDWPKGSLFAFKSKRGNLLLAAAEWTGYGFLQYVLKKSVTIRGRHYLAEAMKKAEPEIVDIMGEQVQIAIDRSEKK
jgi:hypothetical protein